MNATIRAGGDTGRSARIKLDDANPSKADDGGPAPMAPARSSLRTATSRDAAAETLNTVLRAGDAAAILLGFLAMTLASGYHRLGADRLGFTLVSATLIGLWAIRFQDAWNERVIAMRTIEIAKVSRAVAILGIGMLVLDRLSRAYVHVDQIVMAIVGSWLLLLAWRSFYRAWLAYNRRRGRFTRSLVVIGTDRGAVEMARVLAIHPEAGMRLRGVIGSRPEAESAGLGDHWLGGYGEADEVLAATDADVVVVCSSDVSPLVFNSLLHEEHGRQLYVHPGLSGIDARRVKASPIAHEPLLYVEAATLSRAELALKRAFDVAVATGLLVLFSPVFAAVALAVKLGDRGPVFFRQERVGQGDNRFAMLKFRTMVVGAEGRLAALQRDNERNGPLFKLDVDPRVTRVGRFLRASSLDELPQLINVVRGEMSLVGPRPALPAEVAEFPIELRERHRVRPGITGLWQVEARDNPSFDAYQRLDLFYVENWSTALDLVILLGTAEQLLLRPLFKRGSGEMTGPVEAVMAFPGHASR